jgi:outer membrane lipoprotein-sorting protein
MFAQDDLKSVLAQMDAASARFHSAQADFEWDEYEVVVQSTDKQTGSITFVRNGAQVEMAAMLNPPQQKQLVYKDGKLQMYEPKIDQLSVFIAGGNRSQYESFLTLGFGGSGKAMAQAWTVTYLGKEVVDGVSCAKLNLVPVQQSLRTNVDHVTLWLDPSRDVSLKQQFFEPSGDYRLAHYTNIKLNERVNEQAFRIKTTSKTKTIQH